MAAAARADVLRQRLRRVPDPPVHADDPARHGRGRRDRRRRPVPDLRSVILPQAWPVIVAVAIFHLVYSWNDFFGPLIYLSTKPELQPLAVGLSQLQRHPLPQPGLRPGRHPDDDGHPGGPVPGLPAGVHPRHRHQRRREVSGPPSPTARSGSRSRSTRSTPTGRTGRGIDAPASSTCSRARVAVDVLPAGPLGRGRARARAPHRRRGPPGRQPHASTTPGCRS